VRLGAEYPRPLVDHDIARKRALDALGTVVASRAAEGD
jgi:deoxyribodipyrimidine photolyase